MQLLEIVPKKSIGPVELGMDRKEVYAILGEPKEAGKGLEWVNDYHIQYDDNDKVIFIEIPNSFIDTHFVLYKGVDVFATEAKILVKILSEDGDYEDEDEGYSYSFNSLGIGFWRPVVFEYEMVYDPEFQELLPEIQLDEIKHRFFETVCVFVDDYYKK
ncbi:hypothetical protein PV797_08160 [Clostridiaceae bacterium M8S5]|nr:hypothetical protein PV797_08160 [Clostridiaceae bacterium M8S5]